MSRFDSMFRNAKGRAGPAEAPPENDPAPEERPKAPAEAPPPALPSARPARRMGRPPGKKSDPAYEQVTAYVPRELYGSVRSVLWNNHGRKEFSQLVSELLAEWLDGQMTR